MLSGYTKGNVNPRSAERTPSGKHSRDKGVTPKRTQSERIREIWPDLREMILPRRGLLLLGLALMIINRLSGLVLPYSTRFLIDDVLGKKQVQLLTPLVLTGTLEYQACDDSICYNPTSIPLTWTLKFRPLITERPTRP